MKKFVVLSLLMLMGLSACAEFIMAPEWSEFCPVEYLSAKYTFIVTFGFT